MNETDHLSLSRYVDGDLSPLERKKVEAMLDSDPAARRMFAEYSRMSQFVHELPREPLNHDLVPGLRESLARKRRFGTIPVTSPAIAGILAASVLFATFTIAYVARPLEFQEGEVLDRGPGTRISGSNLPSARSESKEESIASDQVSPTAAPPDMASETATGAAPNVAMALSQSVTNGRSPQEGNPLPTKVPAELDVRFRKFLKATESTDRRHSIRLHVSSASQRQIDSILSVIGQFRASDSAVIERKLAAEGDKPSLSYVALIPTGRMADFRAALRRLRGIDMEQDRPESFMNADPQSSKGFRIVENEELARSIEANPPNTTEAASEAPVRASKSSSPDDVVPDAISQPLKIDTADRADGGTLDEVIIWIRTDPLQVGKEAPPTRPD